MKPNAEHNHDFFLFNKLSVNNSRLRVEVSLFVLSSEIEDLDEVEVELGEAQKDLL
jgi:hypothetical protein